MGVHNVSEKQGFSPKARRFILADREESGVWSFQRRGTRIHFLEVFWGVSKTQESHVCIVCLGR